jgi:sigma-B regulation protein RsbU (phosphoserine phosphatase)
MAEAHDVQARFLPDSVLRLASLECAGLSLSACGVGGDSYDFLKASPQRLALALADVSGHGLPAALMAASLQACLRTHYAHGAGDLAGWLRSVNRLLLECTAAEHFATLFLAEHDDRTRGLRYVNCGHPPALLLRADGRRERLGSTAPLLGVLDEWACSIEETTLDPDDTLVVYSDGATEAMNPAHEPFGEERLETAARDARSLPVARLARTIADRVIAFAGGNLADDLTLVVARPRIPASLGRRMADPDRGRRTSTGG